MKCSHAETLLPPYALGSLEPDERESLQEHILTCSSCFPLAQEHLAAASLLAPPAVQPPPALRARVLARVARAATSPPLTVAHAAPPVASRFPLRTRWPAAAFAFAGVVALFFVSGLAALLWTVQSDLRELQRDSQRLVAIVNDQRDLTYTLALPGMNPVILRTAEQGSRARGMLMASQDQTWGVLVSLGLEAPGPGKGYQVWLVRDAERVSGGVFAVDEEGYGQLYIRFPVALDQFAAIGVTQEPMEGSPGPTGKQVLRASLR